MSLITHIEASLGELDRGWSPAKGSGAIQVARFRNQPFEGTTTYVTLGLSNSVLPMSQEHEVRQEFVFSAYDRFVAEHVASFMLTFGEYVLAKKQALLRGDVVGPGPPLIPDAAVTAVYAAIPVVFKEGFATYNAPSPPTVMVWLVPLLSAEANFVKQNGWSRFEGILETEDPDLWDLNRGSIV